MAQSKTIKNQATSAKRAASTITSLVEMLDWEKTTTQNKSITQAERDVLIKAVSILNQIGTKRSKLAKQVNSAELKKEKAIKLAESEVKNIITTWPVPQTTLEKVAIALSDSIGIARYLETGLPIWNREATAQDWVQMLDDLVQDAYKSMVSSVAYHAVTYGKPLSEVLSIQKEKFTVIKTHNKTLMLAKAWEDKINS